MLGYGAGAASVLLARQLRPILVEVATAVYQITDTIWSRVAMVQEDFEDVLAEARARVYGPEERASA
jgi:hypothetical protein